MEHNIGVGAIIGLVTASSFYIYNSNKFNNTQKTILLVCILFPPAQWLGILIVSAYNSYIENNSVEKVTERKVEQKANTLNSQIKNLKDLKEKGILTEEEYNQKTNKIDSEKKEENLKNSQEYKQLKSLLDSRILTKEEFEDKLIVLKTLKPTKSDIEKQDFKIIKTEEISTFKDGRIEVFKIYHKKDEYYFYEILKSKKVFISIENNRQYFSNRNEFLDYFKDEII